MRFETLCRAAFAVLGLLLVPVSAGADESELREQVETLTRENRAMRDTLHRLEAEVARARDEARAARDQAARSAPPPASEAGLPRLSAAPPESTALIDRPLGPARLQLLDVSLDVLAAAGGSTAEDDVIEILQGGGHDPRQRGFTLQAIELGLRGAVDPYFDAETHLVYFLDPEGESRFEIEEAFATTRRLPFGLEEAGLQLELGTFYTEFGRINPLHSHAWSWMDQPVVLTRFFGEDGLRGPGARLGWLLPLPWFSELHLGLQNAKGETMVSFLANDEVFEERPIGGRPFGGGGVHGMGDLVYLTRWVNGFDLSDTWSAQLGGSFLAGPNATGSDGRTLIYGADAVFKWRPLRTNRGWPFVTLETELARRDYRADDFQGCLDADEDPCADPVALPSDTLRDWGGYAQVLWGFRRPWAAGLRVEYAAGSGDGFDATAAEFVDASEDPYRDDRTRISPLLVFYPSEFSRLRLQYNYDATQSPEVENAHSVWAGIEFLFGAHPSHGF